MKFRTAAALLPLVLLAGCAKAATTTTAASAACTSAAADTVIVTAAFRDGRADPAPHRVDVKKGSSVQLQVAADRDVQVHIHGYDLEYRATPATPGCLAFQADRTGLFDVEAHPDTLLVQLEVR